MDMLWAGVSALLCAVVSGQVEAISTLLSLKADVNSVNDQV